MDSAPRPARSFTAPRSLRALIGPKPKVIDNGVWAKLLWAGLNLEECDLTRHANGSHFYPIPMVNALTIVWLFGGLRSDEIQRLRVGCTRENWNTAAQSAPPPAVCNLDVPVNKTSQAFTKPVDQIVGESIRAWEAQRPDQPAAVDGKTGEIVHFLFVYRGRRPGKVYINKTLVPILCNKAGVPLEDARGKITSHRARSTIASQLYNAKEPMSLFELQRWLGHKWANSTQHYLDISPTKLAQSFRDAGYFARNARAIEVLIDREAVMSGKAAEEPWKFYDLGHGYCAYDFFDQCPHRMACAKCGFYIAKDSSRAQLLEGKANLLRMRQEIPLNEAELSAVDDGVAARSRSSWTNWQMSPRLLVPLLANCGPPSWFRLPPPNLTRTRTHDARLGRLSGGEGGSLDGDGARQLWHSASPPRPRLLSRALSTPSAHVEEQSPKFHSKHREERMGLPFRFVHCGERRADRRQRAGLHFGHGELLHP